MNLNGKQIIAIVGAVLAALMVSTTQLTDLFGPTVTKTIISTAGLIGLILNSITAAISGQASMVKEVAAMPGVEPIKINENANSTLAAIAVDPMQQNIGGTTPQVQTQLKEIAKG